MMKDDSHRILARTLSDTLANLAFMFTDNEPADIAPDADWLEVEISYHGPVHGRLLVRCTRSFAVRLSANLLGIDATELEAELGAEDGLCEFANVLCGQLVTALHDTDDVFNLSVPRLRPLTGAPEPATADLAICIHVEGDPLQLVYSPGLACPAEGCA